MKHNLNRKEAKEKLVAGGASQEEKREEKENQKEEEEPVADAKENEEKQEKVFADSVNKLNKINNKLNIIKLNYPSTQSWHLNKIFPVLALLVARNQKS